MSWLGKLFGFKEEPADKYAKDYAKAIIWGVKADKVWQETENAALLNLEKTGEGG